MVPIAGAMERESKSWIVYKSASIASGVPYIVAPATIKIAELTKRANVHKLIASSIMEYFNE